MFGEECILLQKTGVSAQYLQGIIYMELKEDTERSYRDEEFLYNLLGKLCGLLDHHNLIIFPEAQSFGFNRNNMAQDPGYNALEM
ncbi:hypothetical protein Y1Q_0017226 [Alligator mississippiensis]|uniref:Uncharacterized protein n=1 Tax=Alligator mississippiensis TaxID=8496 RepID=A0A151NKX6_ALLMI|nr:hypothetical protein Y1Q_0017226 [Alligator mississippiensis]